MTVAASLSKALVNELLGMCIVEEKGACIGTAKDLLREVNQKILSIRELGRRPKNPGDPWRCAVGYVGQYKGPRKWLNVSLAEG